jgi:SAM-dependent methyltransferase
MKRLENWGLLRSFAGRERVTAASSPDAGRPTLEPEGVSPDAAPTNFVRGRIAFAELARESAPATRVLYDRLQAEDILAVEQVIRDTPGAWEHYEDATNDGARRQILLAFGAWLGAEGLLAKTSLSDAQPPDDVHAMARGPLATVGGLYEADLILDALQSASVDTAELRHGLDFGCSSGRVVRVLAAACPQIEWHGCDPNGEAIRWAGENLSAINFFVNEDLPPLPLPDQSLDIAYAISIWSHFAPELGLLWFEEMRRLLRPGGHLVCTTHGLTSVAHYATGQMRTAEQSREIQEALYRDGCWYAPEFGDQGDWGVVNPEWGTAFLSPEWMLSKLCPDWQVLEFAAGRNQENQDVYVLERV